MIGIELKMLLATNFQRKTLSLLQTSTSNSNKIRFRKTDSFFLFFSLVFNYFSFALFLHKAMKCMERAKLIVGSNNIQESCQPQSTVLSGMAKAECTAQHLQQMQQRKLLIKSHTVGKVSSQSHVQWQVFESASSFMFCLLTS